MMRISNELSWSFTTTVKQQASLIKEYGISQSALTKWIKQYSTVETESGEVITAKQVKDL